jgi:hypothetical protein
MKRNALLTLTTLLLAPLAALHAAEPFPGEKTDFHGCAFFSVPKPITRTNCRI